MADVEKDRYSRYKGGLHPSDSYQVKQVRDKLEADASIANSRLDVFNNRQGMGPSNINNDNVELSNYVSNRDAFEMTTFNRYGWLYPDDEMGTTQGLVFIVRPDLNILRTQQASGDAVILNQQASMHEYFRYLNMTDPTILWGLTQQFYIGNTTLKHMFVPFLFDRVEEYSLPDYEIKVNEITQPFTNFKSNYAGNSNDSLSGSTVTVTFRETSNLRVMKYFQAWVEYMNCLSRGVFEPSYEYKYSKFTNGAIRLDYATSMYFIRVKPDMEIVYFHKQTGLFPKSVPHNQMAYNRGQFPDNRISIEFVGGYPEALSPNTMAEFNWNSGVTNVDFLLENTASNYGYDSDNYTGGTWGQILVGNPYIVRSKETVGNPSKYYLGWLKS